MSELEKLQKQLESGGISRYGFTASKSTGVGLLR